MATFEEVWRDLKGGQEEALRRKLWLAAGGEQGGEEGLKAILDGASEIVVREAVQKLFDGTTGRRIPPQGMRSAVIDANRDFRLVQPKIDYAARLGAIARELTDGRLFISAQEFETRSTSVLARLAQDKRTANIAKNAIRLPFCLPQMEVDDYGKVLDETLLPAVDRAYHRQFSDRRFKNFCRGTLGGQVTVVHGSRHKRLLTAMVKGPVVGIYFPVALQGFSIDADLEQMDTLPYEFLLAGAIEPAVASVAYPEVLARDWYTPGLDCAALRWRGYSLYFRAYDDRLHFHDRSLGALVSYSGGLVVLG